MIASRKPLLTFVCLCFCVVASACRSEPPATTAAPQAEAQASSPAAAEPAIAPASPENAGSLPTHDAIARKWTGDLNGMLDRRVIRVLTSYSKTDYFVDGGTQRGLVYDAFRLFEDDLNKKLENKHVRVHVVFIPVANDDLIPALLDGRGDIIAARKLVTAWRREAVDFTRPTRTGISSVIVTHPGVAPISQVEDLGGKEVYLRESDISSDGLKSFNDRLAAAGKPPVTIKPAPEVLADEDILEMVNAGLVPMTMVDDYVGEFWRQIFPALVINKAAAVRTDGETAMMIRKNSPELMAELNAFIAKYPEGSLKRNLLLQAYLKNVKYARAATSRRDADKFQSVVSLIRKYSDQYELDYLLMAAQGYQESGLDQAKKSPVGAIGVMQVMPATGKDMKVGDITRVDANIHAGVKYVRYMMDNFYKDEPMDRLNKGLFTFASYNAGPGRISQLRGLATKRGLDPNRWFNHVEVIAAERIGRETVQYVSNIYKYYLAYTMLTEQEQRREKVKGAGGK
jgi:membrane-bound lytic murein transglycosylase MltF